MRLIWEACSVALPIMHTTHCMTSIAGTVSLGPYLATVARPQ